MKRVKASQIVEWSGPCSFMPHGDGRRASMQTWGRAPEVGNVIGLRDKEGRKAAYRVVERAPGHVAADYDGIIVRLEFIPGREIVDDSPSP